jgi:integrative and conjugative element protein (TIGR02256 family)
MLETMREHCARSGALETGGVLLGRYDQNNTWATITFVTGPPTDSRSSRAGFVRGTRGLRALFDRLWGDGEYYVGEWHFHPNAAPTPSEVDIDEMRRIASDATRECATPLLMIIGGDPTAAWSWTAHVLSGTTLVPLLAED